MKRFLPLLLVFVLLVSVCFGACQSSNENDNAQTCANTEENKNEGDAEGGSDATEGYICSADHKDVNSDGECDECGISVVIVLDLFSINDLHGKLCDTSSQSGVDEMTTYIKQAYETEEHVLVLSAGDMWQGSSESNLTKGQIITDWMNELDVVSMTIGNHEYDWGEEYIAQNAEIAEFPFLAINIYDADTDELVDYCQPSVMVERGGASIGIIGAIGDCYSSVSGEVSAGIYFKTGSELTALVKAEAQRLRDAGADFIIYALHDGHGQSSNEVKTISDSQLSSYYDPTLSEGHVDIVFEGHSHQRYILKDAKGVYHIQGGGDNKGISHAEAVINFANGESQVRTAEYLAASVYDKLSDDPIVKNLMDKYEEVVSEGMRVLGHNDFLRSSNEVASLVADLYLKAGIEAFGDEYDIVLGGGYITTRSPYSLSAGLITYSQLQMLLPFDNDIVLCSIKGADLKNRFINTSNDKYFVSYSDYGNSVKNNIDPSATYYVIVDTYSSTYEPNRLKEVKRYTAGVYARDLLADLIEEGGLSANGGKVSYTSIPEILDIGEKLSSNAFSTDGYYVKATIASIENNNYGNLYLKDADGNKLYVYGVYDSTGSWRYGELADPPKVGDEVVLFGQIKKHINFSKNEVIIELISARLIDVS